MSQPAISIDEIEINLLRQTGISRPDQIRFLAQGEYTINYRFSDRGRDLVIRIVTGSQMGFDLKKQVEYEAQALELLTRSGRTPVPVAMELHPVGLPYPYLVIEYLPGRPLDYRTDLSNAAECLAAIHQVEIPKDHNLIELLDPGQTTVSEAAELARSYLEWSDVDPESAAALRRLFQRVRSGPASRIGQFADAAPSIVNTDLNTHNFVVEGGFVRLLDWEKARIGPAVQDLAHFLIPTTTLWRQSSAARLSGAEIGSFLETYLASWPDLNRERFLEQLAAAQELATLRAVAWCTWAVWSSATGHRPITNDETLRTSRSYLAPEFLDSLP